MKILSIFLGILFLGQVAFANEDEDFAEAETLSQQGAYTAANTLLDEFIQNNSSRLYDMAGAWFLKSYNYIELGDYADALYANDRSFKLRSRLHSDEISQNYMREGYINILQGDYEKALHLLYIAVDMPIENPEVYAKNYAYIASAQQKMGNYEKALEQLQQSLDIIEIEIGDDHPDFATGNYDLGLLLTKMNKLAAAEDAFERAFAIAETLENGKFLQTKIFHAKGNLFHKNYPLKALSFYKMGLKFETQATAYQPEAARIHLSIARLHIQQKDEDKKALVHANRVLQMMTTPDLLVFDNQIFAEALGLKALYFLRKADATLLDKMEALIYGEQAIHSLNLHLDLLSSDAARFQVLEEEKFIFETAIQLATSIYKESGDINFAHVAFTISEEAKAIVLRTNRMRDASLAIYKKSLWEEEKKIKKEIREAEKQVTLHRLDKKEHTILAEKRKKFTAFMTALTPFQKKYADYRFNRSVPTVTDLQKDLDKETAILSYFVGADNYWIFSITHNQFQVIELPLHFSKNNTNVDLNLAIASCLSAIKEDNGKEYALWAFSLHEQLIAPIVKSLKGKESLIIIPDGALLGLPFEVLLDKKVRSTRKVRFKKLSYLIKDYDISYSYASTFLQEKGKPDSLDLQQSFLGFAPTFSAEENDRILSDNSYRFDTMWQSDANLRRCLKPDFSENKKLKPLPYSEKEITVLSNLFALNKAPSEVLAHRRANEESFKLNVDKFEFLHLATHSFINNKNPLSSGIVFAQVPMDNKENENTTSDGILYATEILALPIAARLVVLSNCDSGVGTNVTADGTFSLSRVFIEAGAEQVMASLWKVSNMHTSILMTSFYKNVLDGKQEATALRKAKRKMIKKSETANPKNWAGFVLNR